MTKLKKTAISLFVIVWIILFHYESLRAFYLGPLLGQNLPKLKFLFPPAGWIMFYEIGNSWSTAEVYATRDKKVVEKIDPHKIFKTRFVGFDNIHRNVMVNVADREAAPRFCQFLKKKFPEYRSFAVVVKGYSVLTPQKSELVQRVLYQC